MRGRSGVMTSSSRSQEILRTPLALQFGTDYVAILKSVKKTSSTTDKPETRYHDHDACFVDINPEKRMIVTRGKTPSWSNPQLPDSKGGRCDPDCGSDLKFL